MYFLRNLLGSACCISRTNGAELSNIVNLAAVRASVDQLQAVPMKYLEESFDRVLVHRRQELTFRTTDFLFFC